MILWQRVWKRIHATIDAVRSPPSIEIHRSLALLASKSPNERAFVKLNEPTFRVLQRSAYSLLSTTSDLSPNLVVQTSSITGSGNGVVASRSFAIGDVLTLYPGCIYSHLSVPLLESSVFDSVRETDPALLLPPVESAYAALRFDGVNIDALDLSDKDFLQSACSSHFDGLSPSSALGHIIQHCGDSIIPNSVTIPVDFFVLEGHEGGLVTPSDVDDEAARATFFIPPYGGRGKRANDAIILPWLLINRLPYWRAEASKKFSGPLPVLDGNDMISKKKKKRACLVPGLMVVAAQPINKGDELFQDYALSTENPPPWYQHVTSDTRWKLYGSIKQELARQVNEEESKGYSTRNEERK